MNGLGTLSSWGDASHTSGTPTSGSFVGVHTSGSAFVARSADGTLTAWGNSQYGGSGAPSGDSWALASLSWDAHNGASDASNPLFYVPPPSPPVTPPMVPPPNVPPPRQDGNDVVKFFDFSSRPHNLAIVIPVAILVFACLLSTAHTRARQFRNELLRELAVRVSRMSNRLSNRLSRMSSRLSRLSRGESRTRVVPDRYEVKSDCSTTGQAPEMKVEEVDS